MSSKSHDSQSIQIEVVSRDEQIEIRGLAHDVIAWVKNESANSWVRMNTIPGVGTVLFRKKDNFSFLQKLLSHAGCEARCDNLETAYKTEGLISLTDLNVLVRRTDKYNPEGLA